MKFLLVSTHISQKTGYSKVAFQLIKYLATLDIELHHFAFQRHAKVKREYPPNVQVFDVAAADPAKQASMGTDLFADYVQALAPDIMLIYNDALEICKFLDVAGKSKMPGTRIWLYLDQVYNIIHPEFMKKMNNESDRIYFFARHWMDEYRGLTAELSCKVPEFRVLEHGVDPELRRDFKNDPARIDYRQIFDIPQHAVLMLNINRNSVRKRLDLTIMGLVLILKTHNAYLIVVTNLSAHYDLTRVFAHMLTREGMAMETYEKHLKLIDSEAMAITDEAVAQMYQQCDIGINTSDGEGFGLTVIEHLSCGKPQVITDLGIYDEFVPEAAAQRIPRTDIIFLSGYMIHGLYAPVHSSAEVAKAFRACIDDLDAKTYAAAGCTFKSWAEVTRPLLDDIQSV